MVEADVDRFLEIVRTPEVERWWGAGWEPRDVREKLEESDLACWIVEVELVPIGFVQVYEEPDPEHRHAGLDLFLDPAWHGRGFGPEVLRTVASHLRTSVATIDS